MVLLVGFLCAGSALLVQWRQLVAKVVQERPPVGLRGWGARTGRSVMVLEHMLAQSPSPGLRRRGDEQGRLRETPYMYEVG